MDFSARKRQAAQDAQPHRDDAAKAKQDAAAARRRLAALRKQKTADDDAIQKLKDKIAGLERAAKAANNRAAAIEAQIYDIKAVNPRPNAPPDSRTPEQLLAAVAANNRRLNAALARLRKK